MALCDCTSILWTVCSFILVTELCERMAFYTFSSTTVELMTSVFGADNVFAVEMTSLFNALVYLTPVLGGYIADEHWGRYMTIVVFICIYLIGLVFCTISVYPSTENQALFLSGLLIFVSLGAGGIKANVVTLGADQFDENDPESHKERTSYFNYFYWAINIGAIIATGYFSNLAFNPVFFSGGVIPHDYGYFATFIIPLLSLFIAFIVFLSGTPRYVRKPPSGDVFSSFVKISPKVLFSSHVEGKVVSLSALFLLIAALFIIISFFIEDQAKFIVSIIGMCLILICCGLFAVFCRDISWFRDDMPEVPKVQDADQRRSKTISNLRDVVRLLPYWGMLVAFWVCYNQQSTNFQLQGCQMNYLVGNTLLSPAFFSMFDALVIILALPLVDNYLYPFITRKRGKPLTVLQKMNIGFVLVACGMITAGVIENFRLKSEDAALANGYPAGASDATGVQACCVNTELSENCAWQASGSNCRSSSFCGNTTVTSTTTGEELFSWESCKYNSECAAGGLFLPLKNLVIWYQILPYAFVGMGEIFTAASSYELFYSEVDAEFRSVSQGLNLWSTSFGAFAAGGVSSVFASWIPSNLNSSNAHLDYVFYIIACVVIFISFIWYNVQQTYVYRIDRAEEYSISSKEEVSSKEGTNSFNPADSTLSMTSATELALEKV